MKLIP